MAKIQANFKRFFSRHSSGVERIIGNDEVESSNLSGGTISFFSNLAPILIITVLTADIVIMACLSKIPYFHNL